MTKLTEKIIKVYTDYVLAYSKQVDKYEINKLEEDCVEEMAVCDNLWEVLTLLVHTFSYDEEMANDIMDMLSRTDRKYKIDMANNLKNFFEYIQ